MLSKEMQDMFNKQINEELFSSYIYLSMAAYCESTNFSGMASWLKGQAQEELEHAMKFFDFINQRGGRVELQAMGAPQISWESPLAVFENTYEHECKITRCIHELAAAAQKENDFASSTFLQWFITEQVEEEATSLEIVEKLRLADGNTPALLFLDKELGGRTAAEG